MFARASYLKWWRIFAINGSLVKSINNDKDGNILSMSMMILINLCKNKNAYVIMIACMS